MVDYKLFWVTCKNSEEANYLLAIINSDALQEAVRPLMSKGQFGARDPQKHLWRLPIPEFDPAQELHCAIAAAGNRLEELRRLRERQEDKLTVTIARRELRKWLRASAEGQAVETAVAHLLAGE